MTTGFEKGGVDLDTLFMARVNTKIADTGYEVSNGDDLADVFEGRNGGNQIANTGFEDGGVDLASLFRDIDDSLQGIGGDWPHSDTAITTIDEYPTQSSALAELAFQSDGTYDEEENSIVTSYDYLTAPAAGEGDDFYIKAVKNSGDTLTTNITTSYTAITAEKYIRATQSGGTGSTSGNYTITIADDAAGTNATSWTGALTATLIPGG